MYTVCAHIENIQTFKNSHGSVSACPQWPLFQMFMELRSGNWIRFLVCCILPLNFDNCFYFKKNAIQPLKKDDVQKWLSFLKNMADEKVNSSGWRSHWDLTRRQFPTKTRKAFRHNLFSQLVVTRNIGLSLERLVSFRRDSSRYHPPPQIVNWKWDSLQATDETLRYRQKLSKT